MRWWPHKDKSGRAFPLNHLHPIRYAVLLEGKQGRPEVNVDVHVGYGMHCFTKKKETPDDPSDLYEDDRESRTFCHERYRLSRALPDIARTLVERQCGFAKDDNYVTIELQTKCGTSERYAVFFNVKAWKKQGKNSVLVVIQSAYLLSSGKPNPSKGKVRFKVLLGHALRGTKPRKP